jgi:hypothetical protein
MVLRVGDGSVSFVSFSTWFILGIRHDLTSWNQLDGTGFAITIPVAVAGFFLMPGTPDRPRGRFLTEKEIALAKRRMAGEGREPTKPLTIAVIKDVLSG